MINPRRWFHAAFVGLAATAMMLPDAPIAWSADVQPIIVRLSTGGPPGNFRGVAMKYFADQADKLSNGRLKVQIFWSGSLGGVQRSAVDTVRAGGAEMTDISSSNFSAIDRKWAFFDLPFLFKNAHGLYQYMDSPEFAALNEETTQQDHLHDVFTVYDGWRQLVTTKRSIHTPAEVQGVKLRTTGSPVETAYDVAFGAKPTMVDWGETYLALKNGLVDGYVVPYAAGVVDFNMDDAVKYGTTLNIAPVPSPMFMSESFYQKLPPDLRKVIDEAGRQADLKGRELLAQHEAAARRKLEDEGFVIFDPPAVVKAEWIAKTKSVYGQFATQFPPGMIKKIQSMQPKESSAEVH
jgi:TRAP-type C4-dicarboxylate transport system substrate-binding protein